jgi:hypothetical protein
MQDRVQDLINKMTKKKAELIGIGMPGLDIEK